MLPEGLAQFIARHRIAAEVVRCDEAAPTAEAAARILGVSVGDIVKTMVLTDGTRCVAAIVPGDKRLDRKKVAAAVGSATLRFASADEVLAHTGYPAGGVAPFGFAGPVQVAIEASLGAEPAREIVAGGGRPELLLRMSVATLLRHTDAVVAAITRDEP